MGVTLAEVIEEGRRAFAARGHEAPFVTDEWQMFILINGHRLLAVAEAAVEMREATKFYFGRHSIESDADGGSVRLANAASAFDAAARGEK